ncbi:potassium channel family protein [Mucilaginibacter ximonensis]|uniref:Potassium channel family protein n=1 Tax=Mucilaginibacter ximonensis TaxID=538021 RepID=A0ABW5YAI7_9SPHI
MTLNLNAQVFAMAKKLTPKLNTPLGGYINKLSYPRLFIYILVLIIGCGLLYWVLNPYHQGTNSTDLNVGDAIYFSVVTFATLGYGDISPVGIGKALVVVEVFGGMALMALFIGKLSSERQASKLTLIYSTLNHQRITTYIEDLGSLNEMLMDYYTHHAHKQLEEKMEDLYDFVSVIRKYLTQQSLEGELTEYGNEYTLKRLYSSLATVQKTCGLVIRTSGIRQQIKTDANRAVSTIGTIGELMQQFHQKEPKTMGVLNELVLELQRGKNNTKVVDRTEITPELIDAVKGYQSQYPDMLANHRQIAAEIGMTNKLCKKCILIIESE